MKTKKGTKEILIGALILFIGILFFLFSNSVNKSNLKGDILQNNDITDENNPPQTKIPDNTYSPEPKF